VNLVQVDFCKRVPYSPNPSGYYYWTNVYYLDADDFPTLNLVVNRVQSFEVIRLTEDVELWEATLKDPPGRGNVVLKVSNFFGQTGEVPSEGEYSLLNVARWTFRSSTGRYSYRLNRMPLRPSDMDGPNLSDSGFAFQQLRASSLVNSGQVYNSYGELLVSASVDRRLHMWQLRDGTRRRRRNPLTP
jgi:hypothetical protein